MFHDISIGHICMWSPLQTFNLLPSTPHFNEKGQGSFKVRGPAAKTQVDLRPRVVILD
jgi:hypothetical protein